ncbi:MAG: tRNA epoxyqueuosine(34) reductase QueG [Candidatus Eiseniibacteriota bacterium]
MSPAAEAVSASAAVRERALELGFDAVGIAAIAPLEAAARYEAWLAAGRHAGMRWLAGAKHRARRADQALILRNVRALVCVALCHPPDRDAARDQRVGRIARYASGEDYHFIMRDKLRTLQRDIMRLLPGSRALWYADTGAILERAWAERAGLGWTGKHTGLLSRSIGSWFLLGEVLVDRELESDRPAEDPARDHCGSCVRCIDACPTRAIVAPYQLDANRCISYLTIEHRGAIPLGMREAVGDWIFGCDLCQEACPWNRFAPPAREARLHARELEGWTLERFLTLDESAFAALFQRSPVRRTGCAGFLRNVCVALGNRAEVSSIPALAGTLAHEHEALVRAHAVWALGEIGRRGGVPAGAQVRELLVRVARDDRDQSVREEAAGALSRAAFPSPTPSLRLRTSPASRSARGA